MGAQQKQEDNRMPNVLQHRGERKREEASRATRERRHALKQQRPQRETRVVKSNPLLFTVPHSKVGLTHHFNTSAEARKPPSVRPKEDPNSNINTAHVTSTKSRLHTHTERERKVYHTNIKPDFPAPAWIRLCFTSAWIEHPRSHTAPSETCL
ncbi:hypothetical protein DQ04_01551060 [Trypanosoma grayi]|uniref:hypothetical protein n=1 Tax=Trypanosoma grayi TaxID=71804 RepID=UPI0004F46327|nr:hypothetical protein DQ04_01551060 [Trypanosoma grayi]KEG12651.1 hypothetical protein DQ04_01551060 [Trypanosoma grayi]